MSCHIRRIQRFHRGLKTTLGIFGSASLLLCLSTQVSSVSSIAYALEVHDHGNSHTEPQFRAEVGTEPVTIFGLTEVNTLIRLSRGGVASRELAIQGLNPGEDAVSIDQRPCPCEMFVLTNKGRILRVNPDTGITSQSVAAPSGITQDSASYNLEVGPSRQSDDVTIINGLDGLATYRFSTVMSSIPMLTMRPSSRFALGDVNAGKPSQLGAIAYSNNFLRSPSSPLIGIEANQGTVVGVNEATGELSTIGSLGFSPLAINGFDIGPSENTTGNLNSQSYAVITDAASPSLQGLYAVDISSGKAIRLANYSGPSRIRDIAIALGGEFVFFPGQSQPLSSWRVPVLENAGFIDVVIGRVNRGRPNPDPTTVVLNISTPSAAEPGASLGADFSLPEQRSTYLLSFGPNEFERTFRLNLINDNVARGNRGITLRLLDPTNGAVLGAISEARIVIADDEREALGGLSPNITTLALKQRRINLRSLVKAKRMRVPVTVTCTEACRVTAQVTASSSALRLSTRKKTTAIGSVRERLTGNVLKAGTRTIQVSISEKYRKNLRALKRLTAKVRVTSEDAQGLKFVDAKPLSFR